MAFDANDTPSLEIYNLAMLPPSSADVWKKVLASFNALVADAKTVIDNISKCQELLSSIHKQVLAYHEVSIIIVLQSILFGSFTQDNISSSSLPQGHG